VGGQWVSGPNNVHMLNKCKNDKIKVRKKKRKVTVLIIFLVISEWILNLKT
jgi:hypothetical protein